MSWTPPYARSLHDKAESAGQGCVDRRQGYLQISSEEQTDARLLNLHMDPLSITAATIGISHAAVSSIVGLRNSINSFEDAHEVVGDIRTQLENIQKPLDSLKTLTVTDNDTLAATTEILTKCGVAKAVNDCGVACEAFDKKLQKWTRHSSGGKLSLRDKVALGIWNQEKVNTFKARVETCQSSVHFAVTSVQL